MQAREEKQMEMAIDSLILKVTDLKNSIAAFIFKLETEYHTLTWPTILDNFALLSGQISTLNRLIRSEKCPIFKNYMFLPILLSPDRDPELEKLSEGRVFAFTHELVPDYLRTKPPPDVEEHSNALTNKVNQTSVDNINRQLASLNKITNNLIESISSQREDWEAEMNQKYQAPVNSTSEETKSLVASIMYGKGLKPRQPKEMSSHQRESSQQHQENNRGHHGQAGYGHQNYGYHGGSVHINKVPNIKTNIRSAGHPYGR